VGYLDTGLRQYEGKMEVTVQERKMTVIRTVLTLSPCRAFGLSGRWEAARTV
jgi:hypothetical protein